MPSFMQKAAQSDEEIRKTQEKDPADLSGAQEPDWENPETWGGSGSSAGDSASGNAGDPAGGNEDQEHKPAAPTPPAQTSSGASRRPPRRRGRPRGPERVPLTVRILTSTDRKLTAAVEQTGLNPQTLVEQALEAHFRRLKVEDPGPESQGDVA
ncbi:hypothetical protein [Streptomyces swartbergensis]|uniref:Uncharacterized protein n=1 Tax=Streptomyces swartbergensis TaxID=487165 RepID=A0A243S612_9ACTN|nr:hypothetical protein [Streptomyces swartbergensis]OUD03014.1 hypothetical protein CA983_11830 [Streptomyces swartbergensis]